MHYRLILGSSSPARASVLNKLNIPYQQISPDIDESVRPNETPQQLVLRLAIEKAQAVAKLIDHSTLPTYIIGSDQVAIIDQQIVSKPIDHADAVKQLQAVNGKSIQFYTGLCLLEANSGKYLSHIDPFVVHFRQFTQQQIESYLAKEQPYACAGSLRCEGLGIVLIKAMEGKDPNTLIGLPLIDLISLMQEFGISLL
jgi:MAF protein